MLYLIVCSLIWCSNDIEIYYSLIWKLYHRTLSMDTSAHVWSALLAPTVRQISMTVRAILVSTAPVRWASCCSVWATSSQWHLPRVEQHSLSVVCVCLSQDEVANYTCVCSHDWTGRNCEVAITECDSDPCQNGGTCFVSDIHQYTNKLTSMCICEAYWYRQLASCYHAHLY